MFARAVRALAAMTFAAVLLAGCTGTPAPTPSPSPSLSDEEAFAAAEETYRAYVDALNQVDLSDPATFEPVYALTTGEANAGLRRSFTQMHADGWTVSGESVAALVQPSERVNQNVDLAVCLDVSRVVVVDASGESVVEQDRVAVQSMMVTVHLDEGSSTVDSLEGRTGEPLCSVE